MIRISTLRDPVEVSLAPEYPDCSVTLRRLTAMEFAEAGRDAQAAVSKLTAGEALLESYGLAPSDAAGGRFNPRDNNQLFRIGWLIGDVEVAVRAIISWQGFTDETGAVAPINRQVLAIILQDNSIAGRLRREIDKAARLLVTEGNGSGASPSGSSESDRTALAPNTAPDADSSASPAQTDSQEQTESIAPKSS